MGLAPKLYKGRLKSIFGTAEILVITHHKNLNSIDQRAQEKRPAAAEALLVPINLPESFLHHTNQQSYAGSLQI